MYIINGFSTSKVLFSILLKYYFFSSFEIKNVFNMLDAAYINFSNICHLILQTWDIM